MKRILIVGLVLALSVAFFGCSNPSSSSNDPSNGKVVAEKYRGIWDYVGGADPGSYRSIILSENTIKYDGRVGTPSAWTEGNKLYSGNQEGLFTDDTTLIWLINFPEKSQNTWKKRAE